MPTSFSTCQRWMLRCVLASCLAVLGCNSLSKSTRLASDKFSRATEPVRQSWQRVAGSERTEPVIVWDWTVGVPVDAPRAELIAATLPAEAIAQWVPQVASEVRLVSHSEPAIGYDIKNINGTVIENTSDLHNALEQIPSTALDVQIDLAAAGAKDAETALRLDHPTLLALSHAAAPSNSVFRVSEGGNPMLVVRDAGVRTHLVLRVERQVGLVQLVIKTANCGQQDMLLPVDVRVDAGGAPLQCLTVADTLDLLYGTPDGEFWNGNASFAETSEREDYLLPVNFKRLNQQHTTKSLVTQSPALASMSGMRYPGPAVLGDARALTGIMMQRELLKGGESSRTGWLFFASNAVRTADHVEVSIDVGNGTNTYRFMIPKSG